MIADWRRAVVFTHRWLGIAGCLLFAAWFVSGIVMMYARMPRLDPRERHARLPPLDLAALAVSPSDLSSRYHLAPDRLRVTMLAGRPAYRAEAAGARTTVFADTGERFEGLTREQALDEARRFAPEHASTLRYDARITEPDQWTLTNRADLPMYRIALGGADDSAIYFSERSGEAVLKTTARERRIAYAGAVLHWIYFTPFRRHSALWAQSIVWLSLAGSVMCLLGLVWGFYSGWRSPYRGWLRWHHYSGLIFGVFTFTWIFSGLLSMDPWDWHPTTSPTRIERERFSGGPLPLERVTIDAVRDAARGTSAPKEIELLAFRGRPRWLVDEKPIGAIDRGSLVDAARDTVSGGAVVDASWRDRYDAYYYDRAGELPLPVLRVRFADPAATWLYVDPGRAAIVRVERRLSRLNRWAYHGLHSFDFPFLYWRRPLWDAIVILLSLGGIASAITAMTPAWRRLRRHAQRLYS